jgi:hypothetical protein
MIYVAIPAIITAMFGYMFWHAAYRMRRDRVIGQRQSRRGRFRLGRRSRDD